MKSLINSNEPELFDAINLPGAAPLIICCDHAGRHIPAALELGITVDILDLHIAYDIGARQVAKLLAKKMNAPLLLANYSRLVIDLNRHVDDAMLIPAISDNIKIPGNTNLTEADRRQRIEQMFIPYHKRYGEMVDYLQATYSKPIIVSVHSFTPVMQAKKRPWNIGVLWEDDHELAQSLITNFSKNESLVIGQNQPYHASNPRGYAMNVHAASRGVEMAFIEIRQDHIADNHGQRWAADLLYRAVSPLLDTSRV